MHDRSPPLGVAVLRAYAASRIAANGLRATAREIGIRPFGLQYFLDGGSPRSATLKKLGDWYIRSKAFEAAEEHDRAPWIALDILVRDLPPERRSEALRQSFIFYRQLYEALGTALPNWLKQQDRGA